MIEATLECIDRYISEHKDHQPLLTAYSGVARACREFLKDHPEPPETPRGENILVDDLSAIVRGDEVVQLVRSMAGALKDDAASQAIVKHLTGLEKPLEELLEFWRNPETFITAKAKKLKLSDEEIHLFFLLVMKPFFFRICPDDPPETWDKNHCPVCGTLPHFARFEKEAGKRFLACPVCETQWSHIRFACPFCGDMPKEQTYFTAEEFPYFRVYLCGSCKFYIKTAVEKELNEPVHPFIEDLITTQLDEAAIHEGYKRDLGYFRFAAGESNAET